MKEGDFYDIQVPGFHHYSAHGLYHHNCGKSEVGALDIICRAYVQAQQGKRRLYMIGAPTVQALHDYTARSFKQVAKRLGLWNDRYWRGGHYPEFHSPIGDFIFRSAHDPERFRGPNLGGGWLDEASQYKLEAYTNFIACVRDGDFVGDITTTFTPKGRLHWTYDLFGKPPNGAETHETDNTFLVRATSLENPFIPATFYDDLIAVHGENTTSGRQEVKGEFTDVEGAEWPGTWFDHDEFYFDHWPHPSEWDIAVLALDPSKGSKDRDGDYSAIVTLIRTKDGIMYVSADMSNRRHAEAIVAAAVERYSDMVVPGRLHPSDAEGHCDAFAIETNTFQYLFKTLINTAARKEGFDIPTTELLNSVNKDVRIRRLGPHLENKRFRFKRNCKSTQLMVNQIREFPTADHDDGCDCLEMSVRTAIHISGRRHKRNQDKSKPGFSQLRA